MIRTQNGRTSGLTWLLAGLVGIGGALGAAPAFAQDVIVDKDIIYYDGPEFYAPKHILDVYRPAGAEDLPVLIFIHGGAWTSGDKNSYGYLGNAFAKYGFVTVIANYRLTDNSAGSVMHPGHINDVARAFAWTRANVAAYGGDPERVFISGHSAGGHLVSLLAVDPRYLADHDLTPDDIAGVISLSGVYDVQGISNVFGNATQQKDASPIFHVGDWPPPPFLVLYAEFDLGNLGAQAVLFHELLSALPSESQLVMFPGLNHGTIVSGLGNPNNIVAKTMLRFLYTH